MSELTAQLESLKERLHAALTEKEKAIAQYTQSEIQRRSLQALLDGHSQQDKQSRELKASLADCRFQLKKLSQDIATQRTLAQLERVKFMKAHEQKITDLKAQMENSNQDWIRRFDIRGKEYQEQIRQLEQKAQQSSKEQIRRYQQKTDLLITNMKEEHKQSVGKLEQQNGKLQKAFKVEKQKLVEEAEKKLNLQLKAAEEKTAAEIHKMQKQFEIKLNIIQNERRHEIHQHENTKKQFVNVRENLYEQAYKLTTYKDDLEEKVKELRVETQEKAKKIVALNNSIKELEIKHQSQMKNLVQNSKRNLENIQHKSSGDVEQILRGQLIYVETMEHKIKTLEDKHLEQINQYRNQLEHMKHCYEQRPSNSQDLETIKMLQEKLWKKQKQYQFMEDEFKWFKLQLSNKQEMYTRIFAGGHTMSDLRTHTHTNDRPLTRSSLQREYKSRGMRRSLVMKRKMDESKTQFCSLLQSRNRQ